MTIALKLQPDMVALRAEIEGAIAQTNREIETLQQKIANLKTLLKTKETSIETFKITSMSAKSNCASAKSTYENTSNEITKAKDLLITLQRDVNKEYREFRNEVDPLRLKINYMQPLPEQPRIRIVK